MSAVGGGGRFGALIGSVTDSNSFDGASVRELVGSTVGKVDEFGTAGSAVASAFEGIKTACSNAFNFIIFDIFSSFFQQIGLWFDSFRFPKSFETAFRKLMDFLSLIWNFVTGISELVIFYLWSGLSVLLFVIWLIQKHYDPRKELQGPNVYGWQKRGTAWLLWTRVLLTALTTLYLPTVNSAIKVIFCDPTLMAFYEMQCYEGQHIAHLAFALFILLFIGLFLPFVLYRVIRTYQPVPQAFDSDGRLIDVDEHRKEFLEQYADLVAHDDCPYAFLYNGYEYGWSAYKVIALVMKMLLVIPCISFIHQEIVSIIISLVVITVYCLLSTITRPFLSDTDDWLDILARTTSFITLIIQLLVATNVLTGKLAGIILVVFHVINLSLMVIMVLISLEFVRNCWRKCFNKLELQEDLNYDLQSQRKRTIWQRFWQCLLAADPATRPAYERLLELDDIVKRVGREKYVSGLNPPSEGVALARHLARELEGVDVYYKGSIEDPTYWGRMYIKPFPFTCVLVYDVSEKIVEIGDNNIENFVEQNMSEEVNQARKVRRKLRCLDGEMVHFPCETTVFPLRGIACGLLPVRCNCSDGLLRVQTKSNDIMCHGFDVSIEYLDGKYCRDDEEINPQVCRIGNKELGITTDFHMNPQLELLFNDPSNSYLINSKWAELHERMKFYRDDLEQERKNGENDMSYAFWLLVYDNAYIPLEDLKKFLNECEVNKALQNIVTRRPTDFASLYSRLEYYDSHPAIAFWYCFWDDVYCNNMILSGIKRHRQFFDLTSKYAIAYHPVSIGRLKDNLRVLGLRTGSGGGLFNDTLLDQLDAKLLENSAAEPIDYSKLTYVLPASPDSLKDPRCTNFVIPENATYLAQAALLAWNGKE